MNAGRKMGHLVREGISNAFDLTDINTCKVSVSNGRITVEDDSPNGFTDLNLIFTVFMTGKSDSHLKRGRKGRGLKELIAVADYAKVETVGRTVIFDEYGRREIDNDRGRGSFVEVLSKVEGWGEDGCEEALDYLSKIIPPNNVCFILNNKEIFRPNVLKSVRSCLETTVIEDDIQVSKYLMTDVDLYPHKNKVKSWIYEMGIPVSEIDFPYHIDVHQRIPMNDNRDTVSDYYLNRLYGRILDATIDDLKKKDLKEKWVLSCVDWSESSTKKKFAKKFMGENAVIRGRSTKANDIAKQYGFKVMSTSRFPGCITDILEAYIPSALSIAEKISKNDSDIDYAPDESNHNFADFVEWFGKSLLKKDVVCRFFDRSKDFTGSIVQADFNKDKYIPETNGYSSVVRFNRQVKKNDFSRPLKESMVSVMIHEFAHEFSSQHGELFLDAVEMLGGRAAVLLFKNAEMVKKKFGKKRAKRSLTVQGKDYE